MLCSFFSGYNAQAFIGDCMYVQVCKINDRFLRFKYLANEVKRINPKIRYLGFSSSENDATSSASLP